MIERVEKEVVRRRNRPELREPPLRPDAETCVGHGLHGRQGRNVGNQQVFAAQVQVDLRGVEFVGQKPESRQGYDDREGLCVPLVRARHAVVEIGVGFELPKSTSLRNGESRTALYQPKFFSER